MAQMVSPTLVRDARRFQRTNLPELATNGRTSVVSSCRMATAAREISLQHLPGFSRVPQWEITYGIADDGTYPDVRPGDVITVPGFGTYVVTEVPEPWDYMAAYVSRASQARRTDGTCPIYSNYTVTFTRTNAPTDTVTTPVYIFSTKLDFELREAFPEMDWGVLFRNDLTYPSGASIGAKDMIAWSRFGANSAGVLRSMPIDKPKPHNSPLLLNYALFKDNL